MSNTSYCEEREIHLAFHGPFFAKRLAEAADMNSSEFRILLANTVQDGECGNITISQPFVEDAVPTADERTRTSGALLGDLLAALNLWVLFVPFRV